MLLMLRQRLLGKLFLNLLNIDAFMERGFFWFCCSDSTLQAGGGASAFHPFDQEQNPEPETKPRQTQPTPPIKRREMAPPVKDGGSESSGVTAPTSLRNGNPTAGRTQPTPPLKRRAAAPVTYRVSSQMLHAGPSYPRDTSPSPAPSEDAASLWSLGSSRASRGRR